MLILVCGLPATGKSTFARKLARKLRAQVLRTDIVRKELLEKPEYSKEEKELVYNVTFLIAKYLLLNKRNVIIDGTFYKRILRERVREIARNARTKFEIVECVCPEEVVKRRMERRGRRTYSLSDADFEIYKKIEAEFEPIEEEHIVVRTDGNYGQILGYVLRELRASN